MTPSPSTLITAIGELVTNDPDSGAFAAIADAALVVQDGVVAWTGPAARAPAADSVIDAGGRAVLPGFVDSHAHLVFAGERSAEFAARMAGRPYQAGGILTTVAATRAATSSALRANLRRLAAEMLGQGTTTFECKSGYGLTVGDEERGLRAGRRGHARGHLPGRARRAARVHRQRGRLRGSGLRPDADRVRPARPLD